MGKQTSISWCDATFNPWWGCIKVSPGCNACYALDIAKRYGHDVWGPAATTPRRVFGPDHWREPLKWNAAATKAGQSARVFCASMADVFEDHPQLPPEREKLWKLIADTPMLDWLLLTKRPENVTRMAPWGNDWPENVWLGTSVEDQRRAEERLPILAGIPAKVRFISAEPLLGPVEMRSIRLPIDPKFGTASVLNWFDWLIIGGESGPGARPFRQEWADDLLEMARLCCTVPFVKQMGSNPYMRDQQGRLCQVRYRAHKGDDPAEWPDHYQVQEFPFERRSGMLV